MEGLALCLLGVFMERVKGIEPSPQAWEARILPLNHTRVTAMVTTPAGGALQAQKWRVCRPVRV